jgi:hypothetical protein
MNTLQVKIFLLKNDLTLAGIAAEIARTENQKERDCVRVMLSQMVHGHRFYPALARKVEKRYPELRFRDRRPERKAA